MSDLDSLTFEDESLTETFSPIAPVKSSLSIEATLAERDKRYGDFRGHAVVTQALKQAMVNSINWHRLTDDKKEALEMIVHKIGRILNGDPEYKDSWHDIIGYTKLVEDTLKD